MEKLSLLLMETSSVDPIANKLNEESHPIPSHPIPQTSPGYLRELIIIEFDIRPLIQLAPDFRLIMKSSREFETIKRVNRFNAY